MSQLGFCGAGDFGDSGGSRFVPCAPHSEDLNQSETYNGDGTENDEANPFDSEDGRNALFDSKMQNRQDEIDALRARVDRILNKMVQNSGDDVNKLRQKIAEMRNPQSKPTTSSEAIKSWNPVDMIGCPLSQVTASTNVKKASVPPSAATKRHENISGNKQTTEHDPVSTSASNGGADEERDEEEDEVVDEECMEDFNFNLSPLPSVKSIPMGDIGLIVETQQRPAKVAKDPPASLKASKSFLHTPDPGGNESYCSSNVSDDASYMGEKSELSPPPGSLLLEETAHKAQAVVQNSNRNVSSRKDKQAPTPKYEVSRPRSKSHTEKPRPETPMTPKQKVPEMVEASPMRNSQRESNGKKNLKPAPTRDPPEIPKNKERKRSQETKKSDNYQPPIANINVPNTSNHKSGSANHPDSTPDQGTSPSPLGDVTVVEEVIGERIRDPYGDKGLYTGVLVKRRPHGKGTMVYDDGREYVGSWNDGRWHGVGRATFANGDIFEGSYDMDQRHGHGMYQWNDGRVYVGQFFQDQRQGRGTYTWPDGAVYQGEFKAGHRQGQGMYRFADGSAYTGEWERGRYAGVGECKWADGRSYRGEWKDGRADGYGLETRSDGTIRHDGLWSRDRPVKKL